MECGQSFKGWTRQHDVDELLSEFALAYVEGSATVADYDALYRAQLFGPDLLLRPSRLDLVSRPLRALSRARCPPGRSPPLAEFLRSPLPLAFAAGSASSGTAARRTITSSMITAVSSHPAQLIRNCPTPSRNERRP